MKIFSICKVLLIFVAISSQMSGAKIRISERGDFMSGTSDRYKMIILLLN